MSKSLKRIALGVWILLLVAVIVDFVNRWFGENYFSDPNIIIVFNLAAFTVQQRWFQFGLVFLTGIVVGISLDWFDRKSRENKASELRTLGSKFRILSDAIKIQTTDSSGWPNNVRNVKPTSCLHLYRPRNSVCGFPMSACTNCRMRHSFVNTSGLSEGY